MTVLRGSPGDGQWPAGVREGRPFRAGRIVDAIAARPAAMRAFDLPKRSPLSTDVGKERLRQVFEPMHVPTSP